jgi:hypothetical protein
MGQRDVAASQSRQQCLDSGGFQVRMLAGRPARHSASTMAAMASGSCAPSIIEAITVAATRRVRKDRSHPTGGRIEEASTIRGEAQPACPSEFVFIQCGPGVGGSLLLWRMISPWRAKHRRSEPMLTTSAGRRRLRWIQVESCPSRARKYSRRHLHWGSDEKVCRAITFDRNRAATPDHQTGR